MLWPVPWKKFLVYGSGDVSKHANPNHSRASLNFVEPGLYMLLRFQKAAVQGNYETGKQACSIHLRFLTIRDGTIISFDAPNAGPMGTLPQSINARGEITGWYLDLSGAVHGFLREP
jgi:hypothetical protein